MSLPYSNRAFDVGQVLAGKFRIIRPLGFGGMGAVFEVEHELTRHRRALKLLHPQMADMPAVVERFLREASAAGRIGNSHIVETFDAGRLETGEPYIVMELLKGRTLADLLTESGPLDLERTCDLLAQACDGVAAAHAVGIVHRDLKPENLFLTGSRESFVKILDFGISKFDTALTGIEGLTLEGSPMGTPYYMSPEQVKGQKDVDARSDVYALGVVLYECLTAQRPFDGDSLPELIFRIAQGDCIAPTKLRPNLPAMVDHVVQAAIATDPGQRLSSAQDLSRALSSLSVAPEGTVIFVPAPAVASVPPAPMPRGLAMTPGVFSRSSPALVRSLSAPPRNLVRSVLGLGAIVVLAGIWVWARARGGEPGAKSSVAAHSMGSGTNRSAPAIASFNDVGASLSQPATSVGDASVGNDAASQSVQAAGNSIAQTQRSLHPVASVPLHAAGQKALPTPPSATSRAAAQGLAEDNPFK